MTLSDHLRPLLRNHDCVIIPDFGGLVAEYTSAKVQPAGRHLLSPPTRQVAFNQALTRNDGLLVDTLREQLGLSAAEAREHLRQAVAMLHHELKAQQRTELPGIGVFRQQPGRGLQFEYTGTENLLAAAFGLPELTAHPVAAIDARSAREQQAQLVPRLRSVAKRNSRVPVRQLMRGGAIGLAAGIVAGAIYLLSLHPTVLPVAWQGYVPRWEQRSLATTPQQAALVRPSLGDANEPASAAPGEELAAAPTKATATPKELVEMPTVVLKKAASTAPATPVATPVVTKKEVSAPAAPVAAPTAPVVAAAKPAASKPVVSVKDSKAVVVAAKPATTVVAKVPAAPAAIATAAAPAATTIKARTGRFYIMVAAYSSLARAEEGRRELLKTGRPAPQTKIILPFPGTHFYRLTAADFANRGEALVAADRLRQNPHFDKETYKGISVYGY
jgi:cytoskeletal protein RodZ